MTYDLANRLKLASAFHPEAVTANVDGVVVDTAEADGLMISVALGNGATGDDPIVVEASQSNNSDFSSPEVVPEERFTTGYNLAIDADESVQKIGLSPTKRYVRINLVASANTNVPVSAVAELRQLESPDKSTV